MIDCYFLLNRMLYKETRSVHGHLTSNQPIKQKKIVLATKKQTVKKPSSEGTPASQTPTNHTPASQSTMSVASMIRQAIMSPSGSSNQSTPASDKGTPSVPTLLDYANISPDTDASSISPHQNNTPLSNQTTPKTSLPSSAKFSQDSTKNAASVQGNSMSGVSEFTASFMEKLIADELTKTPKESRPSSTVQNSQQAQMSHTEPKAKTSPTGVQGQSIAEIVAATAKAMETTPVPKERQASSVLKQLSTHAQNNSAGMSSQQQAFTAVSKPTNQQNFAAASKPAPQQTFASKPAVSKPTVVRKSDTFGTGQDRLKKLNLGDGKRTIMTANAAKQIADLGGGGNINLSQTIQKLSSNLAVKKTVTSSVGVSSSISQTGKPRMAAVRAPGSATKQNISNASTQPVVRLTRPPGVEKLTAASKPQAQVRLATTKGATIRMVTTTRPQSQIGSNSKTTAPSVRTETTKPARVNVQTLQRSVSSEAITSQVGHLNPATLQAGMGNIFANLSESYGSPTSASSSSKELPYFAASTTTSGKNSHPKTNQSASLHGYRQQTSPTAHPVHASSYSPTKVTKQQSLSASGSAFTAPSPPKHKPSTPPTLSPSTSPVGQKYPAYVNQRTSPNQTSPKFPASYTTSMAAVPGYQHLSLADLTHKQATSGFTQGYPLSANQGQGSSVASQGSGDAIITGPAPGTFYHQHAGSGKYVFLCIL